MGELFKCYKSFDKLQRGEDEDINDYIVRFTSLYNELVNDHNLTLPDVILAYKLFNGSNLDQDTLRMVRMNCQGNLSLDNITQKFGQAFDFLSNQITKSQSLDVKLEKHDPVDTLLASRKILCFKCEGPHLVKDCPFKVQSNQGKGSTGIDRLQNQVQNLRSYDNVNNGQQNFVNDQRPQAQFSNQYNGSDQNWQMFDEQTGQRNQQQYSVSTQQSNLQQRGQPNSFRGQNHRGMNNRGYTRGQVQQGGQNNTSGGNYNGNQPVQNANRGYQNNQNQGPNRGYQNTRFQQLNQNDQQIYQNQQQNQYVQNVRPQSQSQQLQNSWQGHSQPVSNNWWNQYYEQHHNNAQDQNADSSEYFQDGMMNSEVYDQRNHYGEWDQSQGWTGNHYQNQHINAIPKRLYHPYKQNKKPRYNVYRNYQRPRHNQSPYQNSGNFNRYYSNYVVSDNDWDYLSDDSVGSLIV